MLPENKEKWYIMKVLMVPIIGNAFGTLAKCLEKKLDKLEIEGRNKTIKSHHC